MINYAVCEIAGKQYKVVPNKAFEVNSLGEIEKYECDRVLALSEGKNLTLGAPYLKDKLAFEVIGATRGIKIRVAKYSAKANSRRVKGSRSKLTKLKLVAK